MKIQLKTYGMQQKQCRGKFYTIQAYLKKQETDKQPNLTPKETRKRTNNNNKKNPQQKEINQMITAEINEKEMKKTIEKTNKTKSWFFEKNQIDKPLARLINLELCSCNMAN